MKQLQGLTLRDFLNIIYKRIFLLRLVVVFATLGVFINCLFATPVYVVGAKVIVTAKKDDALPLLGSNPGASRNLNMNVDEIDLNSEMEILKSSDLWIRTVKALGPSFFKGEPQGVMGKMIGTISSSVSGIFASREGPKTDVNQETQQAAKDTRIASALMRRFDVAPVVRSKVLDLSFKDSDPEKVQKVLATLLAVYIPYRSQVYSLPGLQDFFAEQLAAAKEKYDISRQKLSEFKNKWNLSIPDRQEQDVLLTVKMIDDSLLDVNSNIKQYSESFSLAKKGGTPSGQLAPSAGGRGESTLINVLAVQLVQSEEKLMQLGELFTEGSRDYMEGLEQYKSANDKFKSAISSEMSILGIKKASLEQNADRVSEKMKLLSEKSEQFRALALDVLVGKEQYLQFLGKEQAARIEEAESRQKLVDVKVLSEPSRPESPVFPRTGLYVLLAFVFSFPLGLGTIFVARFLDHSFDDPLSLESATGYKVLASFWKEDEESLSVTATELYSSQRK